MIRCRRELKIKDIRQTFALEPVATKYSQHDSPPPLQNITSIDTKSRPESGDFWTIALILSLN